MTAFVDRYGPWALVAGASEGLGAAFARALAARGLKLLLVARRAEPLEALARELSATVEVRTAALDLARPDLAAEVRALVGDRAVGLYVHNAAYSRIKSFLDADLDDALRSVDVNCRAPIILAHTLGRAMAARGRGGIVLMSSLTASQGVPLIAAYAATKAFNLVLAEGLWDELRRVGVDVVACRAGAVRTPNYLDSRPRVEATAPMEPDAVAAEALDALGRGPSVMPGWTYRASGFLLSRLLPRRIAVGVMSRQMRKMYDA